MVTVGVDDGSLQVDSQQFKSVGLVRGLEAAWCSACIHRMNQVNSHNDDITRSIVIVIIITVNLMYFTAFKFHKFACKFFCRMFNFCNFTVHNSINWSPSNM